jgi:hypothetical protein
MFIVCDKTMENHNNQLHFQIQIVYDHKSTCVFPTWLVTNVNLFVTIFIKKSTKELG